MKSLKKKIKDIYGLEKDKVYIIKCLENEADEASVRFLDEALKELGINAIVCLVVSKDTITIAEKSHETSTNKS